ncbi:MAG: hypothetical protein M3044_11355 [Thermoproteota archaeon]|nr:hypothetical protein [Thermoproteota archaeon]
MKDTYKTIDIRTILAKPKIALDNIDWVCGFLKVRLTNETSHELNKKHRDITNKYSDIDLQNFRVVLSSVDVSNFDSLINQIKEGHLMLDGTPRFGLVGQNWEAILQQKLTKSSAYTTMHENLG